MIKLPPPPHFPGGGEGGGGDSMFWEMFILNWFYFHILKGGLSVILRDCIIFLSTFLDVTRLSMLTVSFLTQLDSGILYLPFVCRFF